MEAVASNDQVVKIFQRKKQTLMSQLFFFF